MMLISIKVIIICISLVFTLRLINYNSKERVESNNDIIVRPSKLSISGMYLGAILGIIAIKIIIEFNHLTILTENMIGLIFIFFMISLILYNVIKFVTLTIILTKNRMILKTIFIKREYLFSDYIGDEFGFMTEERDKVFYFLRFRKPPEEVKVNIDYISNANRQILSDIISKQTGNNVKLCTNKYETGIITNICILLGYALSLFGLLI